MKNILIIIGVTFLITNLFAQTNMQIRKTDNSLISIPISEIDSIYYEGVVVFICGNQITDFDGNTYNTVEIGTQCWMQENLKTTHYADGIEIPYVEGNANWDNLGAGNTNDAYCYYNDNSSGIYGALYTWAAAMGDDAVSSDTNPSGVQGVCPDGWHLPSDAEWSDLTTFLGGSNIAGGKMKETGTSHWNSPNTGATNESGFNVLPGGLRETHGGGASGEGVQTIFWGTNEDSSYGAWYHKLTHNNSNIQHSHHNKSNGFSVRCVKD